MRLREHNSIFLAETLAIIEATAWAIKMNISGTNYTRYAFIITSKLQCRHKHHTINSIVIKLLKLTPYNIHLHIC